MDRPREKARPNSLGRGWSAHTELYEIINKWQSIIGDKFTLLANNTNKGLALALNDGIELCKGELIARMDSDDIAMPNRFKIQESYMKQHPDVEILGGSLEEFNDEGTLHKVRTYPQNYTAIKNSIHKASPLGHPTVMFRHSLFKRGYRYSNQFFICEDVVLWFEALAGGIKINNISDIVLKFRRNDSMMNRRGKKRLGVSFWLTHMAFICLMVYLPSNTFILVLVYYSDLCLHLSLSSFTTANCAM